MHQHVIITAAKDSVPPIDRTNREKSFQEQTAIKPVLCYRNISSEWINLGNEGSVECVVHLQEQGGS